MCLCDYSYLFAILIDFIQFYSNSAMFAHIIFIILFFMIHLPSKMYLHVLQKQQSSFL